MLRITPGINDCTFEKSPAAPAIGKNRYNTWAVIRGCQLSRCHRQPDSCEYFQTLRAVRWQSGKRKIKIMLRTFKFITRLICLFILVISTGQIAQAQDQDQDQAKQEYTFGVVPQFEQRKLFRIW